MAAGRGDGPGHDHPDLLVRRDACPACGASAGATLVDLPFDSGPVATYLHSFYGGRLDPGRLAGQRYVVVACAGCGLRYQRWVPAPGFLDELYDRLAVGDAGEVAARRGLAVRQAYANDVEQALRHAGGDPAALRVLDYGAGYGLWLDMAAAYGCATTAVEPAAARAERLRAAGHELADPDDLPTGAFHLVNAEQVLEHVVDPAAVLARLAASLAPGGVLRVSVPNGSDVDDRLAAGDWGAPKGSARSLNAVAPLEHVNCFDRQALVALGRRVGLVEFRYPLREYLDPMVRVRSALGAVRARVRPPAGTLVLLTPAPGAARPSRGR